jgi:hypothetical protein
MRSSERSAAPRTLYDNKIEEASLLILLGINQLNKHKLLLLLEQIKIVVHKKVK